MDLVKLVTVERQRDRADVPMAMSYLVPFSMSAHEAIPSARLAEIH